MTANTGAHALEVLDVTGFSVEGFDVDTQDSRNVISSTNWVGVEGAGAQLCRDGEGASENSSGSEELHFSSWRVVEYCNEEMVFKRPELYFYLVVG